MNGGNGERRAARLTLPLCPASQFYIGALGTRSERPGSRLHRQPTSKDPRARPWGRGSTTRPTERGTPARPPAARKAETGRLSAAEGDAALARTHNVILSYFYFSCCASCHARGREGDQSREEGKTPRPRPPGRGPAACARARGGGQPRRPGARSLALPPAPAYRLPAGVAPNTRTTGTFLTGSWVRGDRQISSPGSGLAM